ncbi:MAG: TonB-dependent receptor [Sediminibacterium sp.]|nr:TonB-dependent receptor [Sediminibacterium sp.]
MAKKTKWGLKPLLLAVCTLLMLQTFAQKRTIIGKVSSSDGTALKGATITVKGTKQAVATNETGQFTLPVNNINVVLVVSFVGYEPKEILVNQTTNNIDFVLEVSKSDLDQVVVTGYTSQRKKDITGSVSVVKVGELTSQTNSSAESGLQGLAAGVTVTSSGVPGDRPSVRIRGIQSISLSNDPLYIIDGVPTTSLQDINQNDIENIQILKDAASSAQYGSRASNGVIVITTKKGRPGITRVNYEFYYGVQSAGKGIDILSPTDEAKLIYTIRKNGGVASSPNYVFDANGNPTLPEYLFKGQAGALGTIAIKSNKQGTDWYSEIFKNAPQSNHNLSVSGGGDNSKFFLGLNAFNQNGTLLNTFYKRYTVRANSEFTVKKNIRIGENLAISYSENNGISNQNEGNAISMSWRIKPIIPVYDETGKNFAGTIGEGLGNASNPVANQTWAANNWNHNYRIVGNLFAEVDLIKGLTFKTSFGGEQNFNEYQYYNHQTYTNAENSADAYGKGNTFGYSWTFTNTLTYKRTFEEKHNILVLAGSEAIEEWGNWLAATNVKYYVDAPNYLSINSGGAAGTSSGSPFQKRNLYSIFGKASYNFDDKYYVDATIRRDGSSVFSKDNQYATFPAFSAGWRISNETFLKDVRWITDLKLRASWGQVGNQYIPPLNPYTTFAPSLGSASYDLEGKSNSVVSGFYLKQLGNPDGKWETNTSTNFGFDAEFFKGKLSIVADFFTNKITDLLYQAPLNIVTKGNVTAPYINIGAMTNTGYDIQVGYKDQVTKKFKYAVTANITAYNNNIDYLADNVPYFDDGGWRQGNFVRNEVNHPLSAFYGYKVIGFLSKADVTNAYQADAAEGRFKYADINGDGKITDKDRTYLGNPNPKFTYGLNVNLGYDAFDLVAFFYGVSGKDVINYASWWVDYNNFIGAKSKDALYNSWTPTNTNARLPIQDGTPGFSNSNVFNSSLIEDGSYFRLKNLVIGYTLPKDILKKSGIEKLRFYIQATNIFTITKYRGLDPEFKSYDVNGVNTGSSTAFGIDYGNYPAPKIYTVGLSVTF